MAIHLKLILDTEREREDWESVKRYFGSKSNTDTLRFLIRRTALEAAKIGGSA